MLSDEAVGVLLLCYNRVDNLKLLIHQILDFTPKNIKIYIHIDGPKDSTNDVEKVRNVLEVIKQIEIQHTGRIITKIEKENRGCYIGVREAINWVFMNCKYAVILEDDLQLSENIFKYVDLNIKLLEIENIGSLSLYCEPIDRNHLDLKYVGSFHSSWGWVTSDEKWKYFKDQLNVLEISFVLLKIWFRYGYQLALRFYLTYRKLRKKKLDSWAYRWQLTCLYYGLLSIYPESSLTTNVGFSELSTHTKFRRVEISDISESNKILNGMLSYDVKKRNKQFEIEIIKKRYGITRTSLFPNIPNLMRRVFLESNL